ncbi:MAG: hypothetical protein Q8P70_01480 [bacterium]|nr:hypothetical protein [bacterium]
MTTDFKKTATTFISENPWRALALGLAVVFLSSSLFEVQVRVVPRFLPSSAVPAEKKQSAIDPGKVQELLAQILPTGIPAVYGAELGISYDGVNPSDPKLADQTISTMGQMDMDLTLEGDHLKRYIDILYNQHKGMSCEYCCDVPAIIFENGEPACGCAHSYAMRGLAKYLILNHGESMTDKEILEEMGKWKVLFFPDIHAQKAAVMQQLGMEIDYISLTSNENRGIERGSDVGSMVGGC